MSLPRSPEVAAIFAIARELKTIKALRPPVWATPKLNGVRAMWVPGAGLFSKDGVPYAEGVLPHIEAALRAQPNWLEGELYCHGLTLQQINSRAGVVRTKPHEDCGRISFNVFDAPMLSGGYEDRMNKARDAAPSLTFVPKRDCACCDKAQSAHNAFVSAGFEGTVFKSRGHYVTGSGDFSWKLKAWQDEDYEVVELIEGEGKHAASLGAVMCRAPNGETFKVGAFEFDDDERHAAWIGPRPAKAKVKFMTLTDRGAPHCGRVLALF